MDLKQKIKTLNKCEVSLDQQQINKHWLDTDGALEVSLQMMEEVVGQWNTFFNVYFFISSSNIVYALHDMLY